MRQFLSLSLMLFIAQLSFAQKKDVADPGEAIARIIRTDPEMKAQFDSAYAYAVFPAVGKGAIGVGAASGKGTLYKHGIAVADVDLKQVTIGFQLGGQAYIEVVFLEDLCSYDRFVEKDHEFAAQASAVALASSASAHAAYNEGVKVITMGKGGLMYEASIGGQRLKTRLY